MLEFFEQLLGIVEEYGYLRALFTLFVMAVLGTMAIIAKRFLMTQPQTHRAPDAFAPEVREVGPEVRRHLVRVRDKLGADYVWLCELFTTVDGSERSFDTNGSWIVTEVVRSATAPSIGFTKRRRTPFRNIVNSSNFVAQMIETAGETGFFLIPDTEVYEERLPGFTEVLGFSYYVIAGYDLEGIQILDICVGFFDEQVILTETDLAHYAVDAQAIVALVTE